MKGLKPFVCLCPVEIAETLEEDDFVVVNFNDEFAIVRVIESTEASPTGSADPMYILHKL
jgi:hypothetical protein